MRVLTLLPLAALVGNAPAEQLRFIACPVYRDVDNGRKSGCWLVTDPATGKRYDVSGAPSKPDWNHEVLVEGIVAAQPGDPCGAVVLEPVRTSVLAGACVRHMLPAEGYVGRKFSLPRRNVSPMSVARAVPPGPYGAKTFRLFFNFDQPFLMYQYDDYLLDQAITWLRAAKPGRVTVIGYAASDPVMVSGQRIAEDPTIARTRADRVAEALTRLGVDRRTMTVKVDTHAKPVDDPEADGLSEQSKRRVDIIAGF